MSVYWALFLVISGLVGLLPWEFWYFENSNSAGLEILNHRLAGSFQNFYGLFLKEVLGTYFIEAVIKNNIECI